MAIEIIKEQKICKVTISIRHGFIKPYAVCRIHDDVRCTHWVEYENLSIAGKKYQTLIDKEIEAAHQDILCQENSETKK